MEDKEVIHNIEMLMERWLYGYSEDEETLELINAIMIKGGRLKFHDRVETDEI